MIVTFGVLLSLIFIIEIAGGITAYVYKGEVEDFLRKNMMTSLKQEKPDAMNLWNDIQQKFHCCGVDGPNDWPNATHQIPSSCCGNDPKAECGEGGDQPYQKGCFDSLKERLTHAIKIVGGVGIGIAFIELLGIVFACCLASAIKKEYEGV
uniref:U24-Liphistoxin-Lth1a_1 n=1 Tax=Liphistius thaleban TaxID=1905330 RepID=A0A4V2H919_9ARAC